MASPFAPVALTDTQAITVNGLPVRVQCGPTPGRFVRRGDWYTASHQPGDPPCQSVDAAEPQKKRHELMFSPFAAGDKGWFAFSFVIEPSLALVSGNELVVAQIHLDPALGPLAPALALGARSITGLPGEWLEFVDAGQAHVVRRELIRGHVYSAVLAFTDGCGTACGTLEGWLDGEKLMDVAGVVTGYPDTAPPYAKCGLYETDGDQAVTVSFGLPEIAQTPGNLLSRV